MALDFLAGCLGGCAGIVVGYPLDTVKVHMQTQDYRNPKYKSNWHCLQTILAKQSVAGLYRGMSSPVAGVALVNAIVFGVYGESRRHASDPGSLSSHMFAGALAGIAQSPICSPIELAKTRMQLQETSSTSSSSSRSSGPVACLKRIYKAEGYRGVFRGLGITLLREAPSFGVYFLTYEALSRTSAEPISTARMLLAGGLAGTASWIVSYPLDVVKSRIQSDGNRYAGIIDCLRQSVRTEGYGCLYRGLSSTILRAFPTNAVTFAVVTWTFRLFGQESGVGTASAETSATTPEPICKKTDTREPLLEKWGGFLTTACTRMMVQRLRYSTLSMVPMNELELDCNFPTDTNGDRRTKDVGDEEGADKKLERAVVKQTVGAVSMALA